MSNVPIIAGTLQTDPRSGGQTKKSGVNPLPILEASMYLWCIERFAAFLGPFLVARHWHGISLVPLSVFPLLQLGMKSAMRITKMWIGWLPDMKMEANMILAFSKKEVAVWRHVPRNFPTTSQFLVDAVWRKKDDLYLFITAAKQLPPWRRVVLVCTKMVSTKAKSCNWFRWCCRHVSLDSNGSHNNSLLIRCMTFAGVLNTFQGCDGEVKIEPNMTEDDIEKIF